MAEVDGAGAAFPGELRVLAWPARWPALSLFLLCLIMWLPGALSLPPLDRDESRFAQASKQMAETGNLIDIRFGQEPRYKKPVGIYWLQAAAEKIAGGGDLRAIWAYRLPSLLGGFLAAWLLARLARAVGPPQVGWAAGALLAATLLCSVESIIATTDAALLATVVAAEAVLLRAYLAARTPSAPPLSTGLALAGWAAAGIGILIKGPVTIAVVALTAIGLSLWDRDWRWLRTLRLWRGVLLMLAIALPWLIAIEIASHGAFFQQSLGHDFGGKLVGGQESHGAPPGYFLALLSLTFWPATLFLIPALALAFRQRREPAFRFLLVWAILTWVMMEIVPTKLPHYILPAYPALALLAALWLSSGSAPLRRDALWRVLACVQFAIGLLAITAAPILATQFYGGGAPWWIVLWMLFGACVGLTAVVALRLRHHGGAVVLALVSAVVFHPLLSAAAAPRLATLWVSPRAAALVAANARPGDPPVVASGYEEPSLLFLLGTRTELVPGDRAADLTAHAGGLALIEQREQAAFLAKLHADGATAIALGSVSGLNYSRGMTMRITLYRVVPRTHP